MTYTPRSRERYRAAVWATTATVAAGAISATGWVAGAAAHDEATDAAVNQAAQDAQAQREHDRWLARYGDASPSRERRHPVVRQRPTRTRVTIRYVTAAGTNPAPGPGGTVSPSTGSTSQQLTTVQPAQPASSGTGGGGGGGTGATPHPPPPPPPPPPTPTSGS